MKNLLGLIGGRREVLGIVVLAAMVVIGIIVGLRSPITLSPERDDSAGGITLKTRFSDHEVTGGLLPNNLNDQTSPHYPGDDPPELLQKNANGDVLNLFRIQGEIEYR